MNTVSTIANRNILRNSAANRYMHVNAHAPNYLETTRKPEQSTNSMLDARCSYKEEHRVLKLHRTRQTVKYLVQELMKTNTHKHTHGWSSQMESLVDMVPSVKFIWPSGFKFGHSLRSRALRHTQNIYMKWLIIGGVVRGLAQTQR